MSLTSAILQSWHRPRVVLRGLLAQDRQEGRLLMYLTIGLLMVFVAQLPRLQRQSSAEIPFEAHLSGAIFGFMFMGPLALYLCAALITLLMRPVARVEGYAVRLAVFWPVLATAPLVLAQAALVAATGPGLLALVSGSAVSLLGLGLFFAGMNVALEAARPEAGTAVPTPAPPPAPTNNPARRSRP